MFYVRQITSFKGIFLNKQSQNTKQVGVLWNIWDEEIWREATENFSKTVTLFALTRGREEMNRIGDISPSDGERQRVCRIVRSMVSASAKIYLLLPKKFVSFFSVFSSVNFKLTFSYAILTSYHPLSWVCS